MPFLRQPARAGRESGGLSPSFQKDWRAYALIAPGAASLFIGQPNPLFHAPALVLGFPLCLCLLAALAPTDKTAFFRCWLLGLAGNAAGLYWLVNPMHDVGGLGYELAWPGVLLVAAYLACYSALAGLAMRRTRRLFVLDGTTDAAPSAKRSPALFLLTRLVPAALLSGAAYAGFEVLCGVLFTGFPWLSLSSAFALHPAWVQAASLVGSYGLSAWFAALACLGAFALLAPALPERVGAAVLALALTAALPLGGNLRLAQPLPEAMPLSVLMVQGNIDQNQKWDPQFQESTVVHYQDMTRRAINDLRAAHSEAGPASGPDLVIWPETAMPFYFQAHPEYSGRLRRFAAEMNVNLAFGALGAGPAPQGSGNPAGLYNRLYLLSANGRIAGFYDKEHLVPFGEYIPFASSLTFLRNIMQGLDFSSGTSARPLLLVRPQPRRDPLADAPLSSRDREESHTDAPPAVQASRPVGIGVLICYEAIFPSLAQRRVDEGANVLVNVSNDGWFGKSSAPLQHLGLTAMRAVEQARPIARATNTGYTVAIDARGRVAEHGDRLFVDDTLFALVRPSDEVTLYHRIHPAPEILLVALAFFSLFGYMLSRPKNSFS